ncbi:MAG: hypothetical protein ABWZ63_07255 [Thermoleophilaceae bacterium]
MLHRVVSAAAIGLFLLAGTAHAATTPNLITNPGAEDSPGDIPAGWENPLGAASVAYGTGDFPSTAVSQQIAGGANLFFGGSSNDTSILIQESDASAHAALIDSGKATMTLSGYLGGYSTHEDNVSVVAGLTDASGSAGAFASIGPVTPAERNNQTTLLFRSYCTTVPAGVRQVLVAASFQRMNGSSSDGYADNLSLTLSDDPCPPIGVTPLEPPTAPQPGVSANGETVKGTVRVRAPGSNGFVDLRDVSKIPNGSEIDAKKGTIELQSAQGVGGATQTAVFYSGTFKMTQPANGSLTQLNLSEKFDKCNGRRKDDAEIDKAARSRRLWGRGNGRYTTRGRRASATVRGKAQWLTQDTCAGTLIRVTEGSLIVRDFGKKKNIRLKAPARYLAK